MSRKPLCIDLFCGLGGWTEGFLAEGYDVVGFDIERHQYGEHKYPAQLVIQDVLTLHGSQFRDAAVIVASPPCQRYSYMAMPWTRGQRLAAWYQADAARLAELNQLFEACFHLATDANVSVVVENVKGAQPWVGRAQANYGSFYLWGDIETVNGRIVCGPDRSFGCPKLSPPNHRKVNGFNFHQYENTGEPGGSFQTASVKGAGQDWSRFTRTGEVSPHWTLRCGTKNDGGSWFNIAHNTTSGTANNPVSVPADHIKTVGHVNKRDGHSHTRHLTNQRESDAVKQAGLSGPLWFDHGAAAYSSNSISRKAASAMIAKIPFELSSHIARCFKPR